MIENANPARFNFYPQPGCVVCWLVVVVEERRQGTSLEADKAGPGREESNGRGETLLGAGKKLPRGAAKMCLLA